MRPIPRDPLNPGDDGLPDDYIEDPDLPREALSPDRDDEDCVPPPGMGEQDENGLLDELRVSTEMTPRRRPV